MEPPLDAEDPVHPGLRGAVGAQNRHRRHGDDVDVRIADVLFDVHDDFLYELVVLHFHLRLFEQSLSGLLMALCAVLPLVGVELDVKLCRLAEGGADAAYLGDLRADVEVDELEAVVHAHAVEQPERFEQFAGG